MPTRWSIYIITSSLFLTSQLYRASNAVISPYLLKDLKLTTEGLGLLSASFFYSFALIQIPVGILLDRIGPRLSMTALSFIAIVGAFIFAWADSLSTGVLGRLLMGIGMGCNLMGSLKLLTTWFAPNSFATLSGITFSIGTIGNMLASTPLVLLVQRVGWRMAISSIAIVNLLQIIILYVIVRDRPANLKTPCSNESRLKFVEIFAGAKRLFKKKVFWLISCAAFFRYGVFAAVQTIWAGPYLMNGMGLSPLVAGNIIFLLNVALIIGSPIWGCFYDKISLQRKNIIQLSFFLLALTTIAYASIPAKSGIVLTALLFISFGFSAGTGNILFAYIKERMPNDLAGTTMTAINFFTMLGAAVFIHGFGKLMEHFYPTRSLSIEAFRNGFWICGGLLLLISISFFIVKVEK